MKTKTVQLEGFTTAQGPSAPDTPGIVNLGVFGPEGAGKSRLIATAMSPAAGIITEWKSETPIRQAMAEYGTLVFWPKEDFITPRDPGEIEKLSEDEFKKYYRGRVNRMKSCILRAAANPDIKTLFVDNFGDYCQETKFALQGSEQKFKRINDKVFQDNGPVYQEIIELLRTINKKNTILTNKWRDEYEANAATGRMTWEGFKHLGYHTNVVVELVKNRKWNPDDDSSWHWGLTVRNCLFRPDLEGPAGKLLLRDSAITWQHLMCEIFPEADSDLFI